MAAKVILKRTSVTGRTPNTSVLDTGELALNMTDGKLFSSNGTQVFEVGANLSSLSVNGISFPTTDGSNGQAIITDGAGGLTFGNVASSGGSSNVNVVTGIQYDSYIYSITSNTTVVTGQDDNGDILKYAAGNEDVYLNGLKLIAGSDYVQTNSAALTLTANAVNGDRLEVLNIVGDSTINEYTYTVTANQTIFTGSDDNANLLAYTIGREMVFINGVKLLLTEDYTTPNTTHVILTSNAVSGDTVEVISFERSNGDIIYDTSPQLGGNLDLNNNNITGTGNINIDGSITAGNSTVNAVITSAGNIDTDGTLTVAGAALFNGTTTVNNTFVANGATTIANTLAAGNTTITGFANISSNLTVTSIATFGSDVTISGNLVVSGTRVYANTTTVELGDNIITLNADLGAVAPSENSGFEVNRGNAANVSLLWNETSDTWTLTNDGTNYYDIATNNFVTSTYAPLAGPAFTGNVTFDSTVLAVDSVNDRVGILTTTPGVTLDIGSATDAMHMPTGNTAQRPGSPSAGMFRFNSESQLFEGYTTTWAPIESGTSTFTTDTFTANGSQVDFVLSQSPSSEDNLIVFNEGVFQNQDAYTLSGNTVTFDTAPGASNKIIVYSVKAAVSGSNLNKDTFTANGTQTAFVLSILPVDENNTQVFIDGVYQQKDAYSLSGNTVTFSAAPANSTVVEVMTFTQTSINVPTSNSITTAMIKDGQVTSAKLAGSVSTNNVTVNQDLTVSGNTTLGSNSSDIIIVNGQVGSHIIPSANITYDLGTADNRFRDLYLSGTTIKLGDQTISANATHFSIGTAELSSSNGMLYARQEDIDTAIANLVSSAPSTLDTLNEIATALGSDPDLANTLTTSIATKMPLAGGTFTGPVNLSGNNSSIFLNYNNTVPNNPLHTAFYGQLSGIGMDSSTAGVRIAGSWGANEPMLDIGYYDTSAAHANWQQKVRFSANGNVGIGTSGPSVKLHVSHGVSEYTTSLADTTTKATLHLKTHLDDSTITSFGGVSGGHAYIQRSNGPGTTAYGLLLNPYGGKVGIGTTNPNSILHINSSLSDTWVDINGPASQYTGLKLFRGNGDWASIAHNHFGLLVSDLGLEVSKFTGANATGRSQIMVFDGTNERVGINTNTPAYDLDVNGTFAFRSTGYAYGTPMYWYNGSSYLKIDNPSGGSVGEIGMVGSSLDLRLQSDGGNTKVGGHMIMENSGDYYQVTGASGTAWTISGGGQLSASGSATPGTGSVAFGIHHWNGSNWDTPLTIVGGGGATAHNVKIGRTTSALAEARKLNVYSDAHNNDGVHTINYNGANFYKNCGHWMTAASSTTYLHIKTSIDWNNSIMFRAHMHGYNYGTSSVIDIQTVGYAYTGGSTIATQTVNNGGDANQTFDVYTASDNKIVLRFFVGNSAYYCGVILDMEFAQPTGYNHLFEISASTWATTSSAQY